MLSTISTLPARRALGVFLAQALLFIGLLAISSPVGADKLPPNEALQWERQISYVKSLIDREPSVPLHYMRLAQAYAQMDREGEVLRYTDEAVRRGGSRLAADILVGDFYSNQSRYGEALSRYLRVLTASPSQAHVLTQVWLIVQRARLERLELPVKITDLIDRLNKQGFYVSPRPATDDAEASKARLAEGNARLNSGDIQGALRAYQEAASHNPWNPGAYRGMGIAYARAADINRALGAYHLYLALAPPDAKDVPRVRKIILDFYRTRR